MKVIIVGGGRTGSHLAALLLAGGHTVQMVETDLEQHAYLHRNLPREIFHVGPLTDPATLEAAGARGANVLAAMASDDADNLVVASLARFRFGVRRVISRINNPRHAWLFTPDFGVDVALNQADVMARLIEEEMSLGDMLLMLKLRRGEFSLVEETLAPGAALLQAPLKDLPLPTECVIAAVVRQGKVQIPRGNMMFEAGDDVLALVSNTSLAALKTMLAPSAV